MSDPRDYKLDLSPAALAAGGATDKPASPPTAAPTPPAARPFLNILFRCCRVYARVYKSADGLHYRGHCPRCAAPVHFNVGRGGSDSRTFVVE